MVGWNFFYHAQNDWSLTITMVEAWFYSPVLAAILAMLGFYSMRAMLHHIKIPLLYRDFLVRAFLIISGIYSAYFLGANNMPAIAGAYLELPDFNPTFVVIAVGLAISVGALMADRRVIETVSSGLFPLSPLEALIVVLSCGITLYCFSGESLAQLLKSCHLPTLPLVPIPTSSVLVGSIIGVGLVKGHLGIRWGGLSKILLSWILVPIMSGLICWSVLAILSKGGSVL